MTKKLTILGVHGLGDHRNSTWKADWEKAVRAVFPGQPEVELKFEFVSYDPIFEREQISAWDTAKALWKLTSSAVTSSFRQRKGVVGRVSERVRWTAGYVVAWVEEDSFKEKTRTLILDAIRDVRPDVLLGHSLGSLVTYNAITHRLAADPAIVSLLANVNYVTLGSQIGNPFVVRNLTPGRIRVPGIKHWYHLYNEEDDVFTAPIRIWDASNFRQVETRFDDSGFADHSAERYLAHPATVAEVWRPLAEEALASRSRAFGSSAPAKTKSRPRADQKRHGRKALLVGINAYPNPEDRLEGCVNDVFRMSEVLQECGFPAGSIRVCLDERATAEGIRDRLEWLLDDPRPGDQLVFFYSGHGAQIPEYGEDNEPDRALETLVPYDFDWSPERAITDDQIYQMYSQLPFDTQLAMIFDCCHSGGIHREGGRRARGLTPPDDIRHREIEWNAGMQMWVPRGFAQRNKAFSEDEETNRRFFGAQGTTARLGRASAIRGLSATQYSRIKRAAKGDSRFGPYLPLILQACREDELAYEYRHGVTSFGAFTHSLSTILRQEKDITLKRLVELTRRQLKRLKYEQTPQVLGPKAVLNTGVPWR